MIKALMTTAVCLLTLMSTAFAEQYKTLGEWDVHYIVINTSFLTPEVARSYGLQRSKFQGLVNISVLDSDSKKAQNVDVSGTAVNLLGTKKELVFNMVEEGDAIYYLAVLPFRHQEKYRFDIDIRHGNTVETLKFNHEFYSE
ncbi:MAG: DUF4426 domain-containing protein [Aestuariibacter sp.]